MNQPPRVIVSFPKSAPQPGTLLGRNTDGTAYVRLDSGSAANYPEDRIRAYEDKDLPGGLETK